MKTLNITVPMTVREATDIPPPPFKAAPIGQLEFKPDPNGPVLGEFKIFTTENFMGWELRADNGKIVRFELASTVIRAACREIWNISTQGLSIGSEATQLIHAALKNGKS